MNYLYSPLMYSDYDGGACEKIWLECGVAVDPSLGIICSGNMKAGVKPSDGGVAPGGGGGLYGGGGGAAAAATGASAAGASSAVGGGSGYNKASWLFQPSDYLNLDVGPQQGVGSAPATGAVALPAVGASATILTWKCPNGRYAKVVAIGIDFVPNGATTTGLFVQGILPAQLTFTIKIDGRPVANYGAFNYLPGAVSAPTGMSGIPVKENQTLTIEVKNVSVVVAAQFLAARIQGYLFSKKLHPESAGYQS